MSEHTPGPWTVHASDPEIDGEYPWWVGVDERSAFVADVLGEADARLIAAAPELLTALEVIARPPYQWDSDESRDTKEVRRRIQIARAAIAKAKGTEVSA